MAVIGFCESCGRTTYVGDQESRTCPGCERPLSATRLEPGRAKVIALNESRFRTLNESSVTGGGGGCPVVCECGAAGCTAPVAISSEAYDAVRSHPARFVVAHGHVIPEAERVVDDSGDFVVVEKVGEARTEAVAQARHLDN